MTGTSQSNTSGYDRHRRPDQGPEQPDFNADEFREMLKAAREVLGELEPTGDTFVASSPGLPSGFREGALESNEAATVAIELPEFVNSRGRIDPALLRSFLIDLANREETHFSPSRNVNYLSVAAIYPVVVWATGRQPQPGQSCEDYFAANTDAEKNLATLTKAAKDDFAEPFLKALGQLHLRDAKDRKVPIEAGGENSHTLTVAEVVRLDPVNSCQLLLQQQSPNDGYGIYTVGAALLEFRKIMNLS